VPIRPRALRDSITIFNTTYGPGSGDAARYGDPVPTESTGVTVPAQVTPSLGRGGEKETHNDQDKRISLVRVMVGPDVIVDGLARVEWAGRSWEVFGEPEAWVTRNGQTHHQTFNMRAVEGI